MMKKTIQQNFLARAVTLLLLTLLTATTAWAAEKTTFPLTSGQTWTNTTTNTKYTVSGEEGNLTLTASVADATVNDGKGYIANGAFYGGGRDMSGVKTFVIGDGITSIGEGAFQNAHNVGITAITIGKDVTSIGKNAFRKITSAFTVTFAANSQLTTIGQYAFYHSSGLTSINLGDCLLLEFIANRAFYTCTGLTTLDLSTCTNLATIEDWAFGDCSNLTITILSGVNYGTYAFDGVAQLITKNIVIDGLTYNETDGCYDIGTLTEFQAFMAYANSVSESSRCQGLTFRLTEDIDMTGQTYTPVGYFSGTFNGNSKTITGLSGSNGLFASVLDGGTVTGLTLSGVNIISGGNRVGAIAGTSVGVIENCHVTGSVSGARRVGGIVGYEILTSTTFTNNPRISNCTFSGTVTGTGDEVGGIAGCTIRPIQYCTVSGSTITGDEYVGGIVGNVWSGEGAVFNISNCIVAGVTVISTDNPDTGKIYGYIDPDEAAAHPDFAHDNTIYYGVTCGTGVTATYASGTKATYGGVDYYQSDATFTLNASRTGYVFKGYTVTDESNSDVTSTALNGTTLTLPASDVSITAQWYDLADISVNDAGTEYTIKTAAGWDAFCDALNDKATYNQFSDKTVKLDANIEVSRMAGSQYYDFCGTFDGDGKTLTFNYGTNDEPATVQNVAPFSYVSNIDNVAATIKNLHVKGDIYTSAKYAAGLVGQHWGELNIENCRSSIVIHSSTSGDGTHGGFEAASNGALNIKGCVFDGKLLTTGTPATTNCGGFVGYGTLSISNSLYAPAALADGEAEITSGSCTFVRNSSAGSNCYYTRTLGTEQGKQALTITASDDVTTEARVRFLGTYQSTTFESEDKSILFLGNSNTLYYPESGASIGAQRAYFKIGDDEQQARMLTAFNINFGDGDVQGMSLTPGPSLKGERSGYYTLDGRKLDSKPTKRGVYVNGSKKVAIK